MCKTQGLGLFVKWRLLAFVVFFLGDWCCLFVVLHVCSLCQGSDLGSIGFAVGGLASLDGRFLWELHHGVGVC